MSRRICYFTCLYFLLIIKSEAQVTENFSDGDFSNNPVWVGNSADWVVNASGQLQSNNTIANSTFCLSTANTLATETQWELFVNLKFATSGTNYTDIFLTASAGDLTMASGYFVRIGNTKDEICLYRTGNSTPIIDGTDGVVSSSSNNAIKIKVVRDAANKWILYRDITGTGNSYISEGTVTDATYTTSSYFGFLVKQSTVASFSQKHFFDDIEIKPYVPDITAPVILSAIANTNKTVDVLFNEPLDNVSTAILSNYVSDNSLGSPAIAIIDVANPSLVHLTFTGSFVNGTTYHITINGVKDIAGNTLVNNLVEFSYYTPQQYDIIMDEIMADPDPVVGLPSGREWIELKNTTPFPINLNGFRIGDMVTQSGPMPSFILKPDSFVIVCTGSAVADLSVYGPTISVSSFPSLSNDGKELILKSADDKIMHSVNYTFVWYQNEIKSAGGWTLEMIDTKNPCTGFTNWQASVDTKGGTPGAKNSVDAINPDNTSPKLIRAYTADAQTITLVFDESLDSMKASSVVNYIISDGIGVPFSAVVVSPFFDKVVLKTATNLSNDKIYTITVSSLTDCVGNAINSNSTVRVGLSESPQKFNIVVNEILFNPPPDGTDYVEIYNRSNKIINLKDIYIAHRNTAFQTADKVQVSTNDYLFFPQDFLVLSKDPSIVKAHYVAQNPDAFITVENLPSYNDDKGNVILMDVGENIIDEIAYSEKWHFKLIDNPEGVALERIDYNDTTLIATEQEKNWHSAASGVGYGTPTYKNSQFRINEEVKGQLNISPEIVSPDNDGQDDYANIDYSFPDAGYVANITIFNSSGRPVRYLQRNALCGTKGSFRWDGLGEKNQQLAIGVYIIYTEVFNLKGKKKSFKIPVVLARRN